MPTLCKTTSINVDGSHIQGDHEIRAVICLGSGNNLTDMICSNATVIPDGIKLYTGSDVGYIPHGLAGSANDLIIYAEDGLLLSGLSVSYFDPVAEAWVGPIAPQLFLTNGSLNWGCWKNFAQVAVPFKCRITLLGAFVESPDDDDDDVPTVPGSGVVDDTLNPSSNNAVSNKAVSEALRQVKEMQQELKQTQQDIITGLTHEGVGYTVITLDPKG